MQENSIFQDADASFNQTHTPCSGETLEASTISEPNKSEGFLHASLSQLNAPEQNKSKNFLVEQTSSETWFLHELSCFNNLHDIILNYCFKEENSSLRRLLLFEGQLFESLFLCVSSDCHLPSTANKLNTSISQSLQSPAHNISILKSTILVSTLSAACDSPASPEIFFLEMAFVNPRFNATNKCHRSRRAEFSL